VILPSAGAPLSTGSQVGQSDDLRSYNASPLNNAASQTNASADSFADYLAQNDTIGVLQQPSKSVNFDVVGYLNANSVYSAPSSDTTLV